MIELPYPFAHSTRTLLGDEEYNKLADALSQEQPISIRLNESKQPSETSHTLQCEAQKVPWTSQGYYLSQRPTFTFDPLFHAGCYYVQEAASMFVEQAVKQYVDKPVVMLDLCAAPGGKSTHALSILPKGSLLVANEVIKSRSHILAENITKWGHAETVVTNNDPADFACLPHLFDVILTDVPCSGEGMFRKDPVAVSEWSQENVLLCQQRQWRIIGDIWQCLKPGGLMIYSTCTYNTQEDEENVLRICNEFGAETLPLQVSESWWITGNLLKGHSFPIYRFLPHRTKGEGFFLAVLRKPDEELSAINHKPFSASSKKKQVPIVTKEQKQLAKSWIENPDDYELCTFGNSIAAFPVEYIEELTAIQRSLRIVQAGVTLAEAKGKDLIPSHSLAMSKMLRSGVFSKEELTYQQAIAYLRKEAIVLSSNAPRGFVMLTYMNIPLGFAKNIGNRANNLYPQEWRIRSGYLPEEVLTLFNASGE